MPACPRRRSRARRRERYLQTASGVRRPRLFTFAVALDAGQQGLPLPFVGLAHPRAVVLCRRPTSRERSTKLICRAFLPVAVAGRTLHRPETDHLSGHQTPLPRFAPYDTSWGGSNPGSKQSAPDMCPKRQGATPQRRALSLTQCADDSTFDQSSSSLSFSPLSSASSFLLGSWAMTFAAVRAGVAPFARSALHTRAWIRTRKPDLNWLSCFMP
jgi:hypothetical protein